MQGVGSESDLWGCSFVIPACPESFFIFEEYSRRANSPRSRCSKQVLLSMGTAVAVNSVGAVGGEYPLNVFQIPPLFA